MHQAHRIPCVFSWFTGMLVLAFALTAAGTAHAVITEPATTTTIYECDTTLDPDNATFSAAADNGSFEYLGLCGGPIRVSDPWITNVVATQTNGPFTVTFSVAKNTGAARNGYITLVLLPGPDNATFAVHQAGAADPTTSSTSTTSSVTVTTTSVPECTSPADCDDGRYCTINYCSNGKCTGEWRDCGWGQCDEENDRCKNSWGPEDCPMPSVFGETSPEVSLLRRYRDEVLSQHGIGRQFIKIYYLMSPPAAWLAERSPLWRSVVEKSVRMVLPVIEKQLQE